LPKWSCSSCKRMERRREGWVLMDVCMYVKEVRNVMGVGEVLVIGDE
jgi:hypothetical protein